jgi:hypothetical protein
MHPLAPYAYEVQYRDGRRLRWDSPGGPWGEARLPTAGATRLTVSGHPTAGPLTVELADGITGFALRAAVTLTFPGPRPTRRFLFGVRVGALVRGWRIDAQDYPQRYHGPLQGWPSASGEAGV